MNATQMDNNRPVGIIAMKYAIDSSYIEAAIISCWRHGRRATKRLVEAEIKVMIRWKGEDGFSRYITSSEKEKDLPVAKQLAMKLFPNFYTKQELKQNK